ncbi:hypothetical protein GF324_12665, partial [bacterium]|nr:hypothetical protein [bacterium]
MKRSHLFRTLLILVLIVAAVWYLVPTFRATQLDQALDRRLAVIHEKTNIPMPVLREDIFRFSVDLAQRIRDTEGLGNEEIEELVSDVEYLRGEFYDRYDDAQDGAIRLGLDLQGGMYLVLEVNLVELMENLAKNKDADFEKLLDEIRTRINNDPDANFEAVVQNTFNEHEIPMARYFGRANSTNQAILNELRSNADEAVELTLTKLRNRIDEFGVSEPSITQQGQRRIVVELPGIQDPERARSLIGRTALLEFKFVADPEVTAKVIGDIDETLAEVIKDEGESLEPGVDTEPATQDVTDTGEAEPDTSVSELERRLTEGAEEGEEDTTDVASAFDEDRPFSSLARLIDRQIGVKASDRTTVMRYLARPEVQDVIPPDYEFLWSNAAEPGREGEEIWMLYLVQERAEMTGAQLSDAGVSIGGNDPSQAGAAIVNLTMNREGTRRFARVTENNIGRFLAIILDDRIHMAPRIKDRIPGGQAIIEGAESVESAQDLAIVLRAGALPAPVEIIEER